MTMFIALYRGDTVSKAKLVAVSAQPELIDEFAARLLQQTPKKPRNSGKRAKRP